jgi:hypothetical protein
MRRGGPRILPDADETAIMERELAVRKVLSDVIPRYAAALASASPEQREAVLLEMSKSVRERLARLDARAAAGRI